MKNIFSLVAISVSLVLSGCKEPVTQSPTTVADTPAAEQPADAQPAVVIGIKPVPANDKLPPGPLTLRAVNEYCNIESVNGSVYQDIAAKKVARDHPVKVIGWIVDKLNDQLASDVTVVIEKLDQTQRWEVTGMPPVARQDVADYFKDFPPALLNSGFSVDLDLSTFEPGDYHLFLVRSSGAERILCENSRLLVLE